jgi:uncharacterized membrane protein (UPF0127 family)
VSLVALALSASATLLARADVPIEDLARFPTNTVTIEAAAGGRHSYRVWIADTEARQPRPSAFWMKNTYIPLDLLFVDPRGKIMRIFENATPLSLEPLGVDAPVRAVLELRGGEAARRGIRAGDRLRHPAFR